MMTGVVDGCDDEIEAYLDLFEATDGVDFMSDVENSADEDHDTVRVYPSPTPTASSPTASVDVR